MKLLIKKEFFDAIKSGEKKVEWRDAHITFICEETGERMQKIVENAWVDDINNIRRHFNIPNIFTDKTLIGFKLR